MSERQDALTAHGFEHTAPTPADVAHYYEKARKAALYIVEDLARKALAEFAMPGQEFVTSMGMWCFNANGEDIELYGITVDQLDNFIARWDEYLKLTGTPMRFTATGPVVREW